jgi:hypothetical protein
MEGVLSFVQAHKPYFEVAQAFSFGRELVCMAARAFSAGHCGGDDRLLLHQAEAERAGGQALDTVLTERVGSSIPSSRA